MNFPIESQHRIRSHRVSATVAIVATLIASSSLIANFVPTEAFASSRTDVIVAVGAENEYANVLSQIGGEYVSVTSILNNPNTDPHTFEVNPSVAEAVSRARLIVQNGVGYDDFMNSVEAATPNSKRKIIVAQNVLGLPTDTPNPHLWYDPKTMPAVAKVMEEDLTAIDPQHQAYFSRNLRLFDASLQPWLTAIATFGSKHRGTPVAVTEPVADYLLQAMGARILTPFSLQADIMNGIDPAPEDISYEDGLFTKHLVKVFCYNEQVVSTVTLAIRATAESSHVPVVGVYETMPTPGYDYQSWMMAELTAIEDAVAHGVSKTHL